MLENIDPVSIIAIAVAVGGYLASIKTNKIKIDRVEDELKEHLKEKSDIKERVVKLESASNAHRSMIESRKKELQEFRNSVTQEFKEFRMEVKNEFKEVYRRIDDLKDDQRAMEKRITDRIDGYMRNRNGRK